MLEGKRHGQGKITFTDGPNGVYKGASYDGSWVNDNMEGCGIFKWPNGDSFRGKFNGVREL